MTNLRLALRLLITLLYSLIALPSYASLVSVHYTATIIDKSSQVASFQIGDKIEWGITYNDSGTYATLYNDGMNQIAEQGSGDDTLYRQPCLDNVGPSCTSNWSGSEVQVLSDASFNLGSLLSDMKAERLEYAPHTRNWSYIMGYSTDPLVPASQLLQNDWYEMNVARGSGSITVITQKAGIPLYNSIIFNSIVAEVTPVPVPAATWLFVSGLIGLISVSKHKKRQIVIR